ncbi:MAG: hypothetical protein H0W02_07495 [Ktedonobacteraceae bacterium]|nr:hypothetical protein [Ktedonobacteraceae bacterium]
METGMDRPDQRPRDDHMSSSEGKLPSSPEYLQQQSISPATSPEQRLFRRITWLTLLLGVMFGIFLTFSGGLWYVSAGFIPYAFYPTSPIIYRLLGPLTMTAFGFIPILLGILQRLRRHYFVFRPGHFDLLDKYSWPLNNLIFGLLFIWLGSSNIILLCFAPDPDMWGTVEMVGVVMLGVALLAELLFVFLKNRRATQQ